MESITTFLVQFLLETPGTLILWLFSDKKKSIFEIQEDEKKHLPSIVISLSLYGIIACYFIFLRSL
jgi:hypothetical protein